MTSLSKAAILGTFLGVGGCPTLGLCTFSSFYLGPRILLLMSEDLLPHFLEVKITCFPWPEDWPFPTLSIVLRISLLCFIFFSLTLSWYTPCILLIICFKEGKAFVSLITSLPIVPRSKPQVVFIQWMNKLILKLKDSNETLEYLPCNQTIETGKRINRQEAKGGRANIALIGRRLALGLSDSSAEGSVLFCIILSEFLQLPNKEVCVNPASSLLANTSLLLTLENTNNLVIFSQ